MDKVQQRFWMVLLCLEKPVIPKSIAGHVNKCNDEPVGRFTDINLYPKFSDAIENLYLQGMRNTKEIYEKLLEQKQVPVVKRNKPMAFFRAAEYINAIRKELGIHHNEGSVRSRVIELVDKGITDTLEIMEIVGAEKQYVNEIKTRYLKSKRN